MIAKSLLPSGLLNTRGHLYLELALVLPIIMIICFFSLQFAWFLRDLQLATTLSRELSSQVFRECATLPPSDVQDCLDATRDRFVKFAKNLHSSTAGAEFILSVYEANSTTATFIQHGVSGGSATYVTKFGVNASGQLTGAVDSAIVAKHKFIAIGEIYLPSSSLFTGTIQGQMFYDSTII